MCEWCTVYVWRVCRAWEQLEVTCTHNARRANVLWNIEQAVDSRRKKFCFNVCILSVNVKVKVMLICIARLRKRL